MAFQQGPIKNFIGQGLTFPIVIENGQGKIYTGFDLIRSSIKTILSWPAFQRFFLGEFGSRVEDMIEEPNDDILQGMMYSFVTDSLNQWEKRIEIQDLKIERDPEDPLNGTLQFMLTYRVVNSQLYDNFVFPFYRKIIY